MTWENVSRYSQSEEGREVRTVQVQMVYYLGYESFGCL